MTKDNWIKAFDEKFKGNLYCEQPSKNRMYHYESRTDWTPPESWEEGVFIKTDEAIKRFISQVEKDAIEKRTKLLKDSFKHRTKPVINLDDEDKNCDLCGYDHDFMTEANENAYKVAHLKVELSQAIEKTNKRWESELYRIANEWDDELSELQGLPPHQHNPKMWSIVTNILSRMKSDLLEDNSYPLKGDRV